MTIISQLLYSYQKYASELTGKRIWLACSGGRDSMALAFATLQLYQQGNLPFCPQLIHVNHGLQSANDDWAKMMLDWSNSVNTACRIVDADFTFINNQASKKDCFFENNSPILATEKPERLKVDEQSTRTARYQAIMRQMNQDDVLMLAHHANDQTETLLMRLFNGSGVRGLSGMSEWTVKTAKMPSSSEQSIHLWRPLLSVTRDHISSYVMAHNLPFVDDPTNLSGDNIRSWLRNEVLPTIQQQYPQVIQSTNRTARLLNDANEILQEVYQDDLQACVMSEFQFEPYDLMLNIEQVKQLSTPRQQQLIYMWLQSDEPMPASMLRVNEVMALIHRDNNDQQVELHWQGVNHQYTVRRYRNELHRLREDWLAMLQSHKLWQMQALADKQAELKLNYSQDTIIRAIKKTDKFACRANQQPHSGKKLMQLLGIPSWERQSVQVVASCRNDEVLSVFTPRQTWHVEQN